MREEVKKVEKEPTLKDNPFSVKADIKLEDIEKYFDLKQLDKNPLVKRLREVVGENTRYAIVVGGKGTGKTFSLKAFEEEFKKRGYVTITVSGNEDYDKVKQKLDDAEEKLKNGEKVLLIIDDAADMPLDNFKEFISKIYKLYLDYSSFAFAIATQTEVRRTYEQVFRTMKSYTSEFTKIFGPVDFEEIMNRLYYNAIIGLNGSEETEHFIYEGLRAGVLVSLDAFWGGFRSPLRIEESKQIIKEYIDFYSTGVIGYKPQQSIMNEMKKEEWLEYVYVKLLEKPPKIIEIDGRVHIVENSGGGKVDHSLNALSLNKILRRLYEALKEGSVKDKDKIDKIREVIFGFQAKGVRISLKDFINAVHIAFNKKEELSPLLQGVKITEVIKDRNIKLEVQDIQKNYKVPLFMEVNVQDVGGISTSHKIFFLLARLIVRQQKGKKGGSEQIYSSDRRKIKDILKIKELESMPNHIAIICDKQRTLEILENYMPEFDKRYRKELSNLDVLVVEKLYDRDKAVICELSRLSELQNFGNINYFYLTHLVRIFYSTVLPSISFKFEKSIGEASVPWLARLLLPKIA